MRPNRRCFRIFFERRRHAPHAGACRRCSIHDPIQEHVDRGYHYGLSDRKPTVGFWITVTLVVALIAYPLGIGPASWISSRVTGLVPAVEIAYRPILRIWGNCPLPVINFLHWYTQLGAKAGWYWTASDEWGPH